MILVCSFYNGYTASKQKGIIEGIVTSEDSNEPLPGVNVLIKGTFLGASTDMKGHYFIRNVPPGIYTLTFSMIGHHKYQVENVVVKPQSTITVSAKLKETVIGMNPVVVTASKRRQDFSVTPHSISIVSGAELVERIPLRLDQALETVSGVYFVEGNISIRGSTGYTRGIGSRVLLLIDGVPMNISDTNEINWNILPIFDVEQIEVIKGAGSALYGSNALGGVVNVITREPSSEGSFKIRSTGGVYDQPFLYKPFLTYSRWTNRQLHFHQYQAAAGKSFNYKKLPGALQYLLLPIFLWPMKSHVEEFDLQCTYNNHASTGYRQNGHFQRWNFSLRADHKFDDGSKYRTYMGMSYEKRGEFLEWASQNLPSNLFYSWERQNRRTQFKTFDAYMMYQKAISPRLAAMFRASFISSLVADQYKREGEYFPAQGIGAEIHFDWMPHSAHSLTFGFEFKSDGGYTKFIGKRRGYSIAPFFQDEWRVFRNLTITPGVRYDSYKIVGEPFQETQVNPKFGLNYTPFTGTTLRFSGGSAFRAASVTERFLNAKLGDLPPIIPNENLQAEMSHSYDSGLFQQLTSNWYIDVAVFQNNYRNFIDIIEEMDHHFNVFAQFRNITRARIRGVEAATKANFWNDRISIHANCTWMDAIDLSKNKVMDYRPKFICIITPSLKFGPAEFQMDYRYTSQFKSVKLYDYDVRVPQKVFNLRLTYRLKNTTFMMVLNNAFNYQYIQLERNLGEVRHLMASLMYEL